MIDGSESYWVDNRCGVGVMCMVIGWFHLVNRAIGLWFVPPVIRAKGPDESWKWRNLLMSWVHALIVGSWDLLCFYYYPEMMEDLVDFKNTFSYYLVVFSTGYFLYDFGDMIYHGKVFKMWELTLHHIAVTSMFLYNLLTLKCVGYNVIALLCEVNSFFLHSRKLLQMLQIPFSNIGYRCLKVINLVTFAIFRGIALVCITHAMVVEQRLNDKVYYCFLFVSMTIMNILNPILFWIILKNDFLRQYKKPKSQSNGKLVPNGVKHVPEESKVSNHVCHRPPVTADHMKEQ